MIHLLNFIISLALASVPSIEVPYDGFDLEKKNLATTTLTSLQAQDLFRKFAESDFIPFKYNQDGCHARATAMAMMAEKMGITMIKIYVQPEDNRILAVKKSQDKYLFPLTWYFHVAVATHVQLESGIEILVFDPSLFAQPVLIDDWTQAMKSSFFIGGLWEDYEQGSVESVYFGEKYQFLPYSRDPVKRKEWHPEILEASYRLLLQNLNDLQNGQVREDQKTKLKNLLKL